MPRRKAAQPSLLSDTTESLIPTSVIQFAPAATSQAYGRLTEGIHISGYTFERACTQLEWLLEGDRWNTCGEFTDVNAFLDSLRLDQFRTVAETRKRIAERIKALQPTVSNRQIARTLGVSHQTVNNDTGNNLPNTARTARRSATQENGSGNNLPLPSLSGEEAARAAQKAATRGPVRGTGGTGENEWYTPDQYLNAARDVLDNIDLDPASSDAAQLVVKAAEYFTFENNGLEQSWYGRVWLNPPYTQPDIVNFMNKMIKEYTSGRVVQAIMLTHNYTDTEWFHAGVRACSAICFTRGRVKFYNANEEAAPTQGQAFFYFGLDHSKFRRVFDRTGFVVVPAR